MNRGRDDCNHSGQYFDWWGCREEGRVIKPYIPPPRECPPQAPMYRREDLNWPEFGQTMFAGGANGPSAPKMAKKDSCGDDIEESECEISRDFWPDQGDRSGKFPRMEMARPAWRPSRASNSWGVTRQAPPYTMYHRDRQPLGQTVCRP